MVVRIRLARFGRRNDPIYNIVVAQSKSGRNTKPMEVLGTYDPVPKDPIPGLYPYASEPASSSSTTSSPISSSSSPQPKQRKYKDIRLDTARTKYWLGVGAQPSEPVWKLLSMAGLVERDFRSEQLRQQATDADERHREYWALLGKGPDGKSPVVNVSGAGGEATTSTATPA